MKELRHYVIYASSNFGTLRIIAPEREVINLLLMEIEPQLPRVQCVTVFRCAPTVLITLVNKSTFMYA